MIAPPRRITLEQWDERRAALLRGGLVEPEYGGPLSRHAAEGDTRLLRLRFDDSAAALRLWNFLLTEEERLARARESGCKLVGAMKDLGTVPVMAFAAPSLRAFYPDGAWWIPCVMEMSDGLFRVADGLGAGDSFCPVRAMLGAFQTQAHFPVPDLLVCSVGAVCDDFSAVAQILNGQGWPILWWEAPHRRTPDPGEESVALPGGLTAPAAQVAFVRTELERVRGALEDLAGAALDDEILKQGIQTANRVRRLLGELRVEAFAGPLAPLPALEMLIAEMLAIHFCSDREETIAVLEDLLAEARRRSRLGFSTAAPGAVRVFWVNPVADLKAMNLLEECGARICGADNMFCHALSPIPENLPPLDALARTALADPMIGPAGDRARLICADIRRFGAEAVIYSRIPGASHCATEGEAIRRAVEGEMHLPLAEIEIPPLSDAMSPNISTRIEALIETVRTADRSRARDAVAGYGMDGSDRAVRFSKGFTT